jgi:hypothetical protein
MSTDSELETGSFLRSDPVFPYNHIVSKILPSYCLQPFAGNFTRHELSPHIGWDFSFEILEQSFKRCESHWDLQT